MEHSDRQIEPIFLFKGITNLQELDKLNSGEDAEEKCART